MTTLEDRRAGIERAAAAVAALGEKTLVLCAGDDVVGTATTLLPRLPDVCFVEVGDLTEVAVRRAVDHGLAGVVFIGTADGLAVLAADAPAAGRARARAELLGDITRVMGGTEGAAQRVGAAEDARHAYELWEEAGLLGPAGRELCRRAAGVLELQAEGRVAAQVVLVDFTGRRMVAMYGRLAR